jgi:glycosyltransferase involved in cell wall biosynthesis
MSVPAVFQTSIGAVPLVCIVIPTFNRADVVIRCLEHLEHQTLRDFEVIVVDDGSTDATPQLIEHYSARTTLRLRYIRQANSGSACARNRAVSMTEAPLCISIGDDILTSPTFVATHIQFHRENLDDRAVGLGLTSWNETEQTVTPFMRWMETNLQFDYRSLNAGLPPDWRHFYTSNLSLKTALLRRHPFDERFRKYGLEDIELGYRVHLREGLRMMFLPNALAEHIHPTDFRRVCKRMYTVGQATAFFETLWPDATPPKSRSRLAIRDLLGRNPRLLTPLTWLTDTVTRFWCPNPLLRLTLSAHAAVGRQARN